MPDWSYHPLFKPVLSRLNEGIGREFIHRGMSFITSLPGGPRLIEFLGHMAPSNLLRKNIMGLTIENPVGLSGKIDPLLTGTRAFFNLGFGFIEVGPVTLKPKNSKRPATFNKTGDYILFPNPFESTGINKTIERLNQLKPKKKAIFIRIGETSNFEEILILIESLLPHADAFIFEESLKEEQLHILKKIPNLPKLLLSIRNSQLRDSIHELKNFHQQQLIHGIVIEEDFVCEEDIQYAQPEQASKIIHSLHFLKEHELSTIPTIVSGGTYEPSDALFFLENGADLVMLTSGYVSAGPGLPKRINEGLLDNDDSMTEYEGWKWYWFFGLTIFLGGLLALFFSMTDVILPYDEAFLQLTRTELNAINPNLIYFMAHDRMTLAGTMLSGGILYMQLARHGVRYGVHWARKAINLAGIIGFLGILLFIGYGYFDWLHGVFWLVLSPIFYIGWKKTRNIQGVSASRNRGNHRAWQKSLWAQLCFIVLGFSFVIGGLVIATIGVTSVFVSTDIAYICMTPTQLNEFNEKLIPVIAHDRAGFGGALISVGLLVLTLSLWGFHQGNRWVWYTLFIGGIPAFSAGIFTHFVIGYTTFIHLLPAYFALLLYIVGLILSKDFFHLKERI